MAILMQNLGSLEERLVNLFFRPILLPPARQYY
jgi:hypothetical protein